MTTIQLKISLPEFSALDVEIFQEKLMNIEQIIKAKLQEIEEKCNVKVLYAIESGSRAWGFASKDSDYDVRFIYARKTEDYLKLETTRDVIEYELTDIYDINGWDVKKFLTLLHDSNPVIFEWAQSPIVYKTSSSWEKIFAIINDFAIFKKLIHHYLSMAKHHYHSYFKSEEVILKKYLYVLRPLLCCQWVIEKKSVPPILFDDLVSALFPKELQSSLDKLLEMKKASSEKTKGKRFSDLDLFIEENFAKLEKIAQDFPKEEKKSWEILDKLFFEINKSELFS